MPAELQELKDQLLRTDETFRQMVTEHHDLDERVRHLSNQAFLSTPEQIEEISLKKRKLRLKDQIEEALRRYLGQHQQVQSH
ncbi:MAG: YdcH family protein [Vicinamibacterales bacterium]